MKPSKHSRKLSFVMKYVTPTVLYFYMRLLSFARFRISANLDESSEKLLRKGSGPVFVLMWHSRFICVDIALECLFRARLQDKLKFVISNHRDGEMASNIARMFNVGVIRGSSRDGAYSAMRGVLEAIDNNDIIVITPDGPRGPRFKLGGNIIELARRRDIPVIIYTYSATSAKIFNSWDRFILPIPFISKLYLDLSPPIEDLSKVEKFMNEKRIELDSLCGIDISED